MSITNDTVLSILEDTAKITGTELTAEDMAYTAEILTNVLEYSPSTEEDLKMVK